MGLLSKNAAKVFDIPALSLLDLSHDGSFLLVVSNKDNVHHVYQLPNDSPKKWKPITSGEDRVLTGALSKDDSQFLFPMAAGGSEKHHLYMYDFGKGKATLFKELDSIRVGITKWTPDNIILFSGSSPKTIGIWKYDFSEQAISQIYQTQQMGEIGPVNPKKPHVAWSEYREGSRTAMLIKLIDYRNGNLVDTVSVSETSENYHWVWDESGNNLVFSTNDPGEPTLAVWNRRNHDIHYLQATELGLALDYVDVKIIPKSKEILYAAKKEGQTRLYREPLDGSISPVELPLNPGWVSAIRIGKKTGRIFLAWSSFDSPTQIGEYLPDKGQFKVLVDMKPKTIPNLSQGKLTWYPSVNDWSIPAFDVPPNKEDPKLPGNPIIVLIHGGPSWEFSYDWDSMGIIIQAYAASGFRVFCPNIRGSTGYGREFLEANILDLGGRDLNDVIAACDYLKKKYPASKKIFLTGASYGGFITFLGLTKYPGTFDAGAAIVGITDWFEMHRLGDAVFKAFTEHFFGKPDENAELYHDRSAINYIDQLQDPLYIVHRANDSRCPVEPIYTFMGKAVSLDKPVTIYVEQEAGHGAQRVDHLKKQYGKVIEFFLDEVKKK
jgi:dipeptidyl aminopeptidase/acylaminoacyl peptidase